MKFVPIAVGIVVLLVIRLFRRHRVGVVTPMGAGAPRRHANVSRRPSGISASSPPASCESGHAAGSTVSAPC